MKIKLLFLSIVFMHQLRAQSYKKIHGKAIVVDTHNDSLTKVVMYGFAMDQNLTGKTHSDLARWKRRSLDVQFFSGWN